jgi:hypothetical protein
MNCKGKWSGFVSTLAEQLKRLEQVLDGLDDVTSDEQTARALTELTGTIAKRREGFAKLAPVYSDPELPGPPGTKVPPNRWPTVTSKLDELRDRVRTAPETVRDGRLWTDTDDTVVSLLRDLATDVRQRWSQVRQDSGELDTAFLAALPPGTEGVAQYRELVSELSGLLEKDVPRPGDSARVAELWKQVDALRGKLEAREVPDELKDDLALLMDGRLPLDRYGGTLKAYVERSGLAERLHVWLREA